MVRYTRNDQNVKYSIAKKLAECIDSHPELIEQAIQNEIEKFADIKDIPYGEKTCRCGRVV